MDKWLRHSNMVKVVAVLMGVLLWIVVHMDPQTTSSGTSASIREDKINNVNITVVNMDENHFSIQSLEPSEVTVTLSGKPSALKDLNLSKMRVEVDLGKVGNGSFLLPLQVTGIPKSISAEVSPRFAKVVVEGMEMKEVPVQITPIGAPAEGFKAGKPIVKPNRVLVTVPASRIASIESVRAEVNIDQATSAVTREVKLVAYGTDGKPAEGSINPPVVEVEIPVTSPFKTMPLQVKVKGRPAAGFAIANATYRTNQVTVYGPQEILDKMEFYEGPTVDVTGLTEDKTFTLDIPLNDKITQIEPVKAEVLITIKPAAARTIPQVPINFVGSNAEYTTRIIGAEAGISDLVLEGVQDLLDRLKVQDIQAYVDVTNLAPGKHELPIVVNLPNFILLPEGFSKKVTVEIIAKEAAAPVNGGNAVQVQS